MDDGKTKVSQTFAIAVNTAADPEFATPTLLTTNEDGSKTITVSREDGGELEWVTSAVGPWTGTGRTSLARTANRRPRLPGVPDQALIPVQ